ncbi:phosphotransferase family protein [Croceicoccus mobilis]|nr:phosphotransferase family protein [Croceicoccus mobilis]
MTDLDAAFSGTEEPTERLKLDLSALAAFMAEHVPDAGALESGRKFKGGQSNPTYLLRARGGDFVLRRKPPGELLRGAHAIDREYRAIAALHPEGFPVPRPFAYCGDESIIGSAFYICEHVAGRVVWDPLMPDEEPAKRAATYANAADWLARLHSLEPAQIGLGDFGRPSGYAARNLTLWSKQYRAAEMQHVPDMHWLMDALAERVPADAPTRLIHGDYGIYNIIFAADAPRALAVLDWEMATLGDPFVDLAHHLRPWWLPPAPGAPTLCGQDLAGTGIPAMNEQVERYLSHMGLGAVPDWDWYLAYAQFRFAAMVQGVLKRYADGTAANRTSTHTAKTVAQAAASARRVLEGAGG